MILVGARKRERERERESATARGYGRRRKRDKCTRGIVPGRVGKGEPG